MNKQFEILEREEKQVLAEEKKIERTEHKIEKEEKEILASEKRIFSFLTHHPLLAFFIDPKSAKKKFNIFQIYIVGKITKHKIIFGLLFSLGVVMVWKSIWDMLDGIPIFSFSLLTLILGVGILWFLKKVSELPG